LFYEGIPRRLRIATRDLTNIKARCKDGESRSYFFKREVPGKMEGGKEGLGTTGLEGKLGGKVFWRKESPGKLWGPLF